MPFFSVIIPLYNKQSYLLKTLECLLNQTFDDFEIVVVNDGSTDKSAELLRTVNDRRIRVFHQENKGVSVARNKGMELAEGDYFCFLDADDYWYPDFLETFYQIIGRYTTHCVFSAAIELDIFDRILPAEYTLSRPVEEDIYIENYFKASLGYSVLWTSSSVFHRSVFETSGGFDPFIKSGQDTDLWIRIGEHFDIVFVKKILARYVYDQKSLSRNKIYKSSCKLNYEKFAALERNDPAAKKFLDQVRFSEIITLKLYGNQAVAKKLQKDISPAHLDRKKRMLISAPVFVLKFLVFIQPVLIRLKLRKTYFKE